MDVGTDEARDELVLVLRDFLAKPDSQDRSGPVPFVLDRSWWRQLADLGVLGLALPEDDGGLGFGLADLAVVFEALGEARAPGPLVWTQLAAFAVPALADGSTVVAGVDLDAVAPGDPVLVPYLGSADRLLTLGDRGVVLHDVADVAATVLDLPIDPDTPVSRLDEPGRLDGGEVVGDRATADRLRRTGTVLTAATLVGLSQTAIDVAVAYAKGRHQFGRPIGSFQALKHLLADSYARTNLARAAVYAAAEFEDQPSAAATGFDVPAAKLLAGRAADANARTAIQVFGGMGFAWETPPHLLLKRTWVLEHEFGTTDEHALAVSAGLDGSVVA